jgi:metallo-beta-lactamase family protein
MSIKLSFLGGVGTVTGSRYLLTLPAGRVLVDCGLFQGFKNLRLRNWEPLPVDPRQIDAVVLTHAHLDHSGYVPLLVRNGFKGAVHATQATHELCKLLLPDSGRLQEEDAGYANRHGFSKHNPALPLYTEADAFFSLKSFRDHRFGEAFEVLPGVRVSFQPAGHILGASSVLVEAEGQRILFSGDLGRPDDLLMRPPQDPPAADHVLVESTYGDREHPPIDPTHEMLEPIKRAVARGGVVVMPVFAVGRAQSILYALHLLKSRGDLPSSLPIFLDSPMAIDTTELYSHFKEYHRLDAAQTRAMCQAAHFVRTTDESKALAKRHGPMVILSASGMATGGRVLHHLKNYAPDPRALIVLTGYQTPGTRGATLASGARTVRIHGEDIPLRAEVVQMESASAHADGEQVKQWLARMPQPPKQVYVVHGEPLAADRMRQRIEHELKWRAMVPDYRDAVAL